jgi:outer membrane protein assembly factor BamB
MNKLKVVGRYAVLLGFFCLMSSVAQAQWNRFRGPNGTGVAKELKLAKAIDENSIRWKKELPAGTSSPVIVEGRLYLTSFKGDDRTVHCLSSTDGSELWSASVQKIRGEAATPPNGPATSSIACDGKQVVAFFPDAGLVAFSADGKQLWLKDLGPFSSMHGLCSSPVLHEGTIVLAVDQLAEPYIAAFDSTNGQQKWKTDRLIGITGGYSTPALIDIDNKTYIVSAAPGELAIYDIATGARLGGVDGLANAPVATPIVINNRVYYNEPQGEPIPMQALGDADKNKDGAIELAEVSGSVPVTRLIQRIDQGFGDNDGKVTGAEWDKAFGTFLNRGGFACVDFKSKDGAIVGEVVWKYTKSTPYIPSAVVLEDTAYFVNDGGILQAFDAATGQMLQRARLGEASGQYYASPVAACNKLVLAGRDGKLTLVQAGRPFAVQETYAFSEPIVATPSIDDGKLFVRTDGFLYCIGDS